MSQSTARPVADNSADRTVTPYDLIRLRDFRLVWCAGGLGWMIRWLDTLAIGVFVYQQTGAPGMVAAVTAIRFAPMLFLSAAMGAIAEQFDRRRILAASMAMMVVNYATLLALAASGHLELWHVALGCLVSGLHQTTEFPVRRTMLGEIAGSGGVAPAMTLDTMTHHVMRIVGPATGGLLLQSGGMVAVYAGTAIGFVLALMLILATRYRSGRRRSAGGLLSDIVEGVRYVRGEPRIVGALSITIIANVFGFPYFSMVPVIGANVLGLDAFYTGTLQSADAIGALMGAVVLSVLARPRWFGWIFLGSTLALLVAVILFALSRQYVLSLLCLGLGGLGMAGFSAMQSTIAFATAPPEMRSRAMSLVSLCIGMAPIGIIHLGLMAEWLSAPTALIVMACEGLLALAAAAVFWPELRAGLPSQPAR